jgi:hypothetical protein
MQTGLSDTHPEIEQMQLDILRRLTESDRLQLAFQLSAHVWELAGRAFAERYPHADSIDQAFHFLASQYGPDLAARWRTRARGTHDNP